MKLVCLDLADRKETSVFPVSLAFRALKVTLDWTVSLEDLARKVIVVFLAQLVWLDLTD